MIQQKLIFCVVVFLLLAPWQLNAQSSSQKSDPVVYYSENFDDEKADGMIMVDGDKLTPADNVVLYYGDIRTWEVKVLYEPVYGWGVWAISNSWLIDGNKTADDWMITPKISIGDNAYISWRAKAFNSNADGYEVLISTTDTLLSSFTKIFYMPAENENPTDRVIDLKALGYANQDVYIAFRNNSVDRYVLGIDNIVVQSLPGADAVLKTTNLDFLALTNTDIELKAWIGNLAGDKITTLKLNYSVNNGAVKSQDISGLNLGYMDSTEISHTIPFQLADATAYTVKVWLSDVNGAADINSGNDTLEVKVSALEKSAERKVLFEEFTGAWCGWCPDGALYADSLDVHPNIISVGLHFDDAMEIWEVRELDIAYDAKYPSALIDRNTARTINNRPDWKTNALAAVNELSPVEITIEKSLNTETYEATMTVKATFLTDMEGDFRFNGYVIAYEVNGEGTGYDQKNDYSGNATYPNHPYYSQPSVITGYVHKRVAQYAIGGAFGAEGSLPSVVKKGEVYTFTQNFYVGEGSDLENIGLIAFVQKHDTALHKRIILNSNEARFSDESFVVKNSIMNVANNGKIQLEVGTNETENVLQLDVKNISDTVVKVIVNKIVTTPLAGADFYFCWGETCYTPEVVTSTDTVELLPGMSTNSFKAYIKPNGITGNALINYSFMDVLDKNKYFNVQIEYTVSQQFSLNLIRNGSEVASGSTITVNGTPGQGEIVTPLQVKNNAYSKVRIAVKKTVLGGTLTSGSSYFTWGSTSYTPETEISTEIVDIEPDATNTTFKALFNANGNAGDLFVKYAFINQDNPIDTVSVIVKYVISIPASAEKWENKPAVMVYPNPVTAESQISLNSDQLNGIATIKLVSLNGKIIQKSSVMVNQDTRLGGFFNQINPGVYILQVEQGKFIHQQKIVITD